jgi:hypothetical protein
MVGTNVLHSDGWMGDDGGVGAVSGGQGVRTCIISDEHSECAC